MIENISNDNETEIKDNYINLLNKKLEFDEIQYLKHTDSSPTKPVDHNCEACAP